jgi:TetR/AcrR family tetracycline transcriptional repressor
MMPSRRSLKVVPTKPKAAARKTPKKRTLDVRSEPSGLNADQIVAAALQIIDESTLDAFSMRGVARRLGVFPTALYWHHPGGRNALLAEVAATAFKDVTPNSNPADDWAAWIRELFDRYRTSLHRHPNIAPLLGAQLVSNAGVDPALVENVLTALQAAGFIDQRLVDAYNAVIAAMIGFVTIELSPMPSDDPEGWATTFKQKIDSLSPLQYPLLTKNMSRLANKAFIVRWSSGTVEPLDTGFSLYVEALIAGLRVLAARQAADKPASLADR